MYSNHFFSLTAIAAAALLTGCAGSSSSAPAVTNPYSASGSSALGEVHVNTMRVFGDSYSDPGFTASLGTINWSQQLQARGVVTENKNYALGGARASTGEVRAFDQQINRALSGTAIGDGDLSVVYLGHNDIGRTGSPDNLAKATADYQTGIGRLVAAGAANENRRIFVTQLHDWSRGPGVTDGARGQVEAWNTMLAGVANANANIIAVDMFTAFERVFAAPEAYGFTNVTTADSGRSGTDTLYHDSTHFGNRGQEIITRVYQHYLTRGWDWANGVSAGADSASRLNKDIDEGTLVLGLAGEQSLQYGFRLLPLGVSDAPSFSRRTSASQVFRPFANSTSFGQSAPSGLALDVGLGTDAKPNAGRIGVALLQYEQPENLTSGQERQARQYSSNALSMYWHQPVAGLMFSSQLSHLNLNLESQSQDALVNLNLQNQSGADTWSLENKLRFPLKAAGFNVTPWMSLTGQSHQLDAAQYQSLYTTDVRFSSNRMNELLTGVGVDVQCAPIYLGGRTKLQFGGSLNHISSLYRDAIRVSMEETGSPGLVQSEVFESSAINRTLLNLQASLELAKQVRLQATYGTQLQDVKNTSSLALLANFSY